MLSDEGESHGGSLAKKAMAFSKMSRPALMGVTSLRR
jgi:hypothetical protein